MSSATCLVHSTFYCLHSGVYFHLWCERCFIELRLLNSIETASARPSVGTESTCKFVAGKRDKIDGFLVSSTFSFLCWLINNTIDAGRRLSIPTVHVQLNIFQTLVFLTYISIILFQYYSTPFFVPWRGWLVSIFVTVINRCRHFDRVCCHEKGLFTKVPLVRR